jgi:hypothetical protein
VTTLRAVYGSKTPPEKLTPATRAVLYGAGAIAVLVGPILFLLPGSTGSYWAWEIQNVLTVVFMGANYLAGIGAVWGAQLNRWSVTRVTMPALIVFTVTQLVATVLHLDIFKWSHPMAWAWLAVYVVSPLAAIPVSIDQERRWRGAASDGPVAEQVTRPIFIVFAAISLGVGLALFAEPEETASLWPWSLTPLTARVIGGWLLSGALLYWMLAREPVLERARIGLTSVVVVIVLLLVGAALHREAFDGPAASIVVYIGHEVLAGGVALALLLRVGRAPRAPSRTGSREAGRDGRSRRISE